MSCDTGSGQLTEFNLIYIIIITESDTQKLKHRNEKAARKGVGSSGDNERDKIHL